ncbi:MAG: hypothetical protein Q8Q25_03440 [bacterium]|nr:hypothetical protein [bacterium]
MKKIAMLFVTLSSPLCAGEKSETPNIKKLLQQKPPLEIAYQNDQHTRIRFHTVKKGIESIIYRKQNRIISLTGSVQSWLETSGPSTLLVRDIKTPYTADEKNYATENDSPITCIAIHQNSEIVVFGCQDGTAMHINIATNRKQQRTLSPHRLLVLSYSQDNSVLIGIDVQNNAILWNIENGCCLRLCRNPERPPSPDLISDDHVICSTEPATIRNLPPVLERFLNHPPSNEQQESLLKIIGAQQHNSAEKVAKHIQESPLDDALKPLIIVPRDTRNTMYLSLLSLLLPHINDFA